MGIRFLCPACTQRIHVKDFQGGKRGLCPKCGASIDIPTSSTLPPKRPRSERRRGEHSSRDVVPAASPGSAGNPSPGVPSMQQGPPPAPEPKRRHRTPTDPIAEAPALLWCVAQPPQGVPFGPASGDELRRWFAEGRANRDSLVWRQDWSEWRVAGEVWGEQGLPGAGGLLAAAAVVPPDRDRVAPQLAAAQTAPHAPLTDSAMVASLPPPVSLPPSAGGASSMVPAHLPVPTAVTPSAPRPAASRSLSPEAGDLYYRRPNRSSYRLVLLALVGVVVLLTPLVGWVVGRALFGRGGASQPAMTSEP